jgi:hypothetical protein
MKLKTTLKKRIFWLLSTVWVVFLAGCCCDKEPSGHIYVNEPAVFTRERLVDKRLKELKWLDSRLDATPTVSTLQGARSQSEFTGFSGQITAQFDPLAAAGALGNAQTMQSAQTAAQLQNQVVTTAWQQELQDLQNGKISYTNILGTNPVAASTLQGSNGTFPASPASGSNGAPTALNLPSPSNIVLIPTNTVQLTATEQFQDQLAYRDAVEAEMQEEELDDTHDQVGMTLYTLKFDLSVVSGKHNHSYGRADLTLAKPCLNTNAVLKTDTNKANPSGRNGSDGCTADDLDLYNRWVQALRRNFDTDVMSIQRRFLQGYLTDDEERQLILQSVKEKEDVPDRNRRLRRDIEQPPPSFEAHLKSADQTGETFRQAARASRVLNNLVLDFNWNESMAATKPMELYTNTDHWLNRFENAKIEDQTIPEIVRYRAETIKKAKMLEWNLIAYDSYTNLVPALTSWHDNPTPSNPNADGIMKALSCLIATKYAEAMADGELDPLVTFHDAISVSTVTNDFHYLITLDDDTSEAPEFCRRVRELENDAKQFPYVYAAEPKESAQNLSDSAASQFAMNLSASLAAAIPQIGTSLGTALDYMKQSQYLVETIKREPLLVAYMHGKTNFGWILGPRYKIKKDGDQFKLGYEQISEQESVEATIGVPAWWEWVDINVTNSWLGNNGESKSTPETNCFKVRLRPNMTALVQAFLEDSDPVWFGAPQINPQWDANTNRWGYVVQSGLPAQLLILGRNLWRNPRIFIGSQGTSSKYDYNILPDMDGILATFSNVVSVPVTPGADSHAPRVDLRVVTSDGEAVLKDAVTVLSGTASNAAPNGPKTFVNLQNRWFVAGQSPTLTVNTNLVPGGYAGFALDLGTAANPKKIDQVAKSTGPENGQLYFTSPSGADWVNPMEVALDVMMLATPSSEPASVLSGGKQNVVVFGNLAQSQFAYVNNSIILPKAAGSQAAIQLVVPAASQKLFWDAWPGIDGGTAVLQLTTTAGARLSLGADATGTAIVMKHSDATHDFYVDGALAKKLGVVNPGAEVTCAGVVTVTPATGTGSLQIAVGGTLTLKVQQ